MLSSNSRGTLTIHASIGSPASAGKPYPGCIASTASNGSIINPQNNSANIDFDGAVQMFQILCNTNWPAGAMFGNPHVADLYNINVDDLDECITHCALWNGSGFTPLCVAAELNVLAKTCTLKNSTGLNITRTSTPGDGAILLF